MKPIEGYHKDGKLLVKVRRPDGKTIVIAISDDIKEVEREPGPDREQPH